MPAARDAPNTRTHAASAFGLRPTQLRLELSRRWAATTALRQLISLVTHPREADLAAKLIVARELRFWKPTIVTARPREWVIRQVPDFLPSEKVKKLLADLHGWTKLPAGVATATTEACMADPFIIATVPRSASNFRAISKAIVRQTIPSVDRLLRQRDDLLTQRDDLLTQRDDLAREVEKLNKQRHDDRWRREIGWNLKLNRSIATTNG